MNQSTEYQIYSTEYNKHVETLKKVAIKESIKGINELAGAIGETKTTVSTTAQRQAVSRSLE